MMKAELIQNKKAILGEGPIWDFENKVLYWIDILNCELHIYNPKSNHDRVIKTNQYIGTVVPREAGGVVLAMEKGFYFLDIRTEKLEFIADPEDGMADKNSRVDKAVAETAAKAARQSGVARKISH